MTLKQSKKGPLSNQRKSNYSSWSNPCLYGSIFIIILLSIKPSFCMDRPPQAADNPPSREIILETAARVLKRNTQYREASLKKDLDEEQAGCWANICICSPLGALALFMGGDNLLHLLSCAGSSCLNITAIDIGLPLAGVAMLGLSYAAARNYFATRNRRTREARQEELEEALIHTILAQKLHT